MSSITYELPGFPLKNQLHDPTTDGQVEENASWDCVPTSLACGLQYLTGRDFNGDELHDAVYGQGYTGGQSAANYVAYCAAAGVTLAPFNGSPDALVAEIHTEISAGHPVVLTMPSQWGTPVASLPSGHSTHVGIAYGTGPGMLRVMNPWIAPTPHDGDDAYWAARLEYNQVWVMRRTDGASAPTQGAAPAMLDISNGTVAQFFFLTSAGKWHCKLTNQEIGGGFLQFYQSVSLTAPAVSVTPQNGMTGLGGLTLLGLPLTGELNPFSGMAVQIFERGALVWDPKRQLDNPPGLGSDLYLAHINSGPVLAFLSNGLQQQLTTATAALSAAQQQLAQTQSQANDAVNAAKAAQAQAQQQLADAQSKAASDAQTAAQQLKAATDAQAAAEATAAQAKSDLEAAQAQLAQAQQQVADAVKGLAVVSALKAAMA